MVMENDLERVSLREAWIDSHVERMWLHLKVHRDWETPMPTRSALRAHIESRLKEPLTEVLGAALLELEGLRQDNGLDTESREREARAAVHSWNEEWSRLTNDGWEIGPTLTDVQLQSVYAPGIDLRNADLSSLQRARAKKFMDSNFEGADFRGANLCHVLLFRSNLGSAKLANAHLCGARLTDANVQRADFTAAKLIGTALDRSDLSGARFVRTDLTSATMHRAALDSAEILGAVGLRVDENSVYRTRFVGRSGIAWRTIALLRTLLTPLARRIASPADVPPRLREARDAWSSLRGDYTGANFVLTLMLVALFALPHVGRAIALRELSAIEAALLPARTAGEDARPADPKELIVLRRRLAERLAEAEDAYDQGSIAVSIAAAAMSNMPDCVLRSGNQTVAFAGVASLRLESIRAEWRAAAGAIAGVARGDWSPETVRDLRHATVTLLPNTSRQLAQAAQNTKRAIEGLAAMPRDCAGPAVAELRDSLSRAQEQLTRLEQLIEAATPELRRLAEGERSVHTFPIWKVLLGLDEAHDTGSVAAPAFFMVLLVYNVLRGFLTITISPMREAEDRSHVTPAKVEYEWLLRIANVVSWMKFAAIALALYGFVEWMKSPVLRFW